MRSLYRIHSLMGRWLLIALMALTIQVNAASTQDTATLITLKLNNTAIEDVFLRIEAQTGFSFMYSTQVLDKNEKVSVDFKRQSLGDALRELLGRRNLRWIIKDRGIVILQNAKSQPSPGGSLTIDSIPKIDVRGAVTDKSGNPIAGATVSLKGYSRGQSTDNAGRFAFTGMPANGTIVVSSLGFEPQQVRIQGQRELVVRMDTLIREIQGVEVVSTGYQTIPKERATGSFVQIDNATINRSVSTNLLDRLLNVTSSLKTEGNIGTNISIRGISTIHANMVPLVVIDGFPYEEGSGQGSAMIALNNINPSDVESVTILRDAAAASIWGARSGNGVIVITTKKGAFNRKISLQINSSVNVVEHPDLKKLKLISSRDAVEVERELFKRGYYDTYNGPFPVTYSYPVVSPVMEVLLAQKRGEISAAEAERQLEGFATHDVRDDIEKHLMQTAINQQYNVNVSGGGERNSYYGSIGYDKNKSFQKRDAYSRFSLRMENTFRPNRKIDINLYFAYTQGMSNNNGFDYQRYIADGSRLAAPYTRFTNAAGQPAHTPTSGTIRSKYIDTIKVPGLLGWHFRPIDELSAADNTSKQHNVRIGGGVRYTILPGLSVEVKGQYENTSIASKSYFSEDTYFTRSLINTFMFKDATGKVQYPVPRGGILDFTNTERRTWNIRGQINFDKSWNRHSLTGILGSEAREFMNESNTGRKFGYNPLSHTYNSAVDFRDTYAMRPAGNGRIAAGNNLIGTLNRFISHFGNAAYMFDNRFGISISGRVDGSNYFGVNSNQRIIPLWSTGISWNLGEEKFYNFKALPYLKMRLTYGFNGNLNNNATALPTINYQSGDGIYNSSAPYAGLRSAPNPGLTWEKVQITNLGIDFGFKNRRIDGSIDVYQKKGVNLIGSIISEPTTGYPSYTGNYAGMRGNGIDLILNTLAIDRKLQWIINLQISYNTDKITDYNNPASILSSARNYFNPSLPVVGKPLVKLYAYRWAGLDGKTGSPRGYVADTIAPFNVVLTGNNTLPKDLVYCGNVRPPLFGSLMNTWSFKGVSLSMNLTYKFNYYFRRSSIDYNSLFGNWGGHSDYALRWKKPGDEMNTIVPAFPSTPNNYYDFYRQSEVLIERADFVSLQDVRVGYSYKRKYLQSFPFSSLQVFVYASNLGLIWRANKLHLEPEYLLYPRQRTIAIGANISL